MKTAITNLPKSEVELKITVEPEEIKADIEAAAKRISESVKIPGFRSGHAPYDTVKARVGEMKIWEEALETVIRRTYYQALRENALAAVGQPYFSVETLAPGNPIIYKVKTAILPKVTKLADLNSIKVAKKEISISEDEVDTAIKQLSKMQVKENEIDRPASAQDKVVVDMEMHLDNVPLEGGQTKGHSIYLAESYYIPGLNEKLVGIKKGEIREFPLDFPKEHFQKNLAGKKVDFKVTAAAVFELMRPALDDAFAKSLGQETMEALRALIKNNLQTEAEIKETQRQEIEILEKIVDGSLFEEIPDILLNTEIERMLQELENSISSQGMEWNKYLEGVKKTIPQLKLDFSPRALRRVKTALVIKEIAQRQGISGDDNEVSAEIARAMNEYKNDLEAQKAIRSEEYAEQVLAISRNKKTVEYLRNLIVK